MVLLLVVGSSVGAVTAGWFVDGILAPLGIVVHGGAALAAAAASRHTRGLARMVWALFAAAQIGRAALQLAPEAGISSVADGPRSAAIAAAFMALSAPTAIAVLVIYRRLRPERGWQGVLDGVIAVLALAAATWALLISAERPMGRDLLYLLIGVPPFLDLLCAVALAWVIGRHGMRSAPGWLRAIVVGLLVQSAAGLIVLSASGWAPGISRVIFMAAAVILGFAAVRRRETTNRAWAAGLHDAPPAWSERLPYVLGSAVVMVSVARPDIEMRLAAALAAALMTTRAISAVAVRQGLIGERDRLLIADPLTGAYNRRFLADQAPRFLAHAQRSGEPLSVVALDLDQFKNVNDILGHDVGDRLLIEVARVAADALRTSDVLVRLGGDEFLVVCPATPGEGAATLAERLRLVIRDAATTCAPGIGVSASLGIATYPADAGDLGDLLRQADEALYASKAAGRDAVRRWAPPAEDVEAAAVLSAGHRQA